MGSHAGVRREPQCQHDEHEPAVQCSAWYRDHRGGCHDQRDRDHRDPNDHDAIADPDVGQQARHHRPNAGVSVEHVAVQGLHDHARHGEDERRSDHDPQVTSLETVADPGGDPCQRDHQHRPHDGIVVAPVDELIGPPTAGHEDRRQQHRCSGGQHHHPSCGRCQGGTHGARPGRTGHERGADGGEAERGHLLVPDLTDQGVGDVERLIEAVEHRADGVDLGGVVPDDGEDVGCVGLRERGSGDPEGDDRTGRPPAPLTGEYPGGDDQRDGDHHDEARVCGEPDDRRRDRSERRSGRTLVDESNEEPDRGDEHERDERLGPDVRRARERGRRQRDHDRDRSAHRGSEIGDAAGQPGQDDRRCAAEHSVHGERPAHDRRPIIGEPVQRADQRREPRAPRAVVEHVPPEPAGQPPRHRQLGGLVGGDVERPAIAREPPPNERHERSDDGHPPHTERPGRALSRGDVDGGVRRRTRRFDRRSHEHPASSHTARGEWRHDGGVPGGSRSTLSQWTGSGSSSDTTAGAAGCWAWSVWADGTARWRLAMPP